MGDERHIRAHVLVSGRVQRVGFRYAVRDRAHRAGVNGWVRNLPDGRVEALLEGVESAVEDVVAFVREGPPGARVEDAQVSREPPKGELTDFAIRF